MPLFGKESALTEGLKKFDEESSKPSKAFKDRVKDNLAQVRGEGQWKLTRPAYFLYNMIAENVEAKVGKLSETRPKMRIMPTLSGLGEAAGVIDRTVQAIWDDRHAEGQLELAGYYGAEMGVAFVGVPWNPQLNFGNGDIDFVVRDPRTVRHDPTVKQAAELDRAEYLILDDVVPLDLVRLVHPGRGMLIEADPKLVPYEEPDKSALGRIKTAAKKVMGSAGSPSSTAVQRCMLSEFWFQDRRKSVEDAGVLPIIEGLTEFNPNLDESPFPGGRRILVGFGKNGPVPLKDTFNPYWDGGYPVEMLSWKVDLETAWGPDEVGPLKKMQEALNRTGDTVVGNILKNGIIRLIVDRGAVDPEELKKFANDAAEIIYKNAGRNIDYKLPLPFQPEILLFMNRLLELGKQKSGVMDSGLQKRVPSIVTGPAIEGLQLGVETGIRSAARRMEGFVERIGQKLISRIFQYYESDRILHYCSTLGEWKSFEFQRTKLISVQTKDKKIRQRTEAEIQKAYRDFRFKVEPGSSLPITKQHRGLMMAEFAKVGAMRWAKVMEEAGIENAEEEVKKAQELIQTGGFVPQGADGRKGEGMITGGIPGGG
jgi:hypothetical protein